MVIDRLDEEFLLLSLGTRGHFLNKAKDGVDYAVAGAWLCELFMHNRIKLDGDKVVHRSHTPMADPVMDEVLTILWSVRRPKSLRAWTRRFKRLAGARRRAVLKRLAERGYIEQVKGTWRHTQHGAGRMFVKQQLREVLEGQRSPDEASIALLSLLDACGLLATVFDGEPEILHAKVAMLTRSYRTIALIADEVRHRGRWHWMRPKPKPGPHAHHGVTVKGKTLRKPQELAARRGFDPRTGSR